MWDSASMKSVRIMGLSRLILRYSRTAGENKKYAASHVKPIKKETQEAIVLWRPQDVRDAKSI